MVTVERTVPWRRKRRFDAGAVEPLLKRFQGEEHKEKADCIVKAYAVAAEAHEGQRRRSGEPYITHPLAVAKVVAKLGLDYQSIAAALLHDAVEDTAVTLEKIERDFGSEVAAIVDGVTKLDRINFDSREAQQSATFRKMIVAMAQDLRVLIVKLSDRLHNLRTIAALPEEKRHRIAHESLELYAPLANRLGMQRVKQQIEDLSFAALHPRWFAEIEDMVAQRAPERDFFLTQVLELIDSRLKEMDISAEVVGREKHLYSIYAKMLSKDKEFNDIYDLVGIRIVVDSVHDCYAALGSLHSTWKPIQGRFKDYIAMPKFNLYQSLHTTVIGPQGKPLEVQIRTHEMHEMAESGAAAHYLYKGTSDIDTMNLPWLNRLVDWEKEVEDPTEFLESLKIDLDTEEVFVFTPAGEVKALPAGATPIDFAYSIHTEVGHRCVGAKVDGKLVPLSVVLSSGETIEILTSKVQDAGPSQDWLGVVRSHRAASKIRQWFSREHRQDAITAGEVQVRAEIKREGATNRVGALKAAIAELASVMDYEDADALYAAVGSRQISAEAVVARLLRGSDPLPESDTPTKTKRKIFDANTSVVSVDGLDDVLVRLSRCCNPVPDDKIMGFVTRGRGVSVHRTDCANADSLRSSQNDRLIDVKWLSAATEEGFVASISIRAYSSSDLLADVSRTLADLKVEIVSSSLSKMDDRITTLAFEFSVADVSHLESVVKNVRMVDGVYDVSRIMPGH